VLPSILVLRSQPTFSLNHSRTPIATMKLDQLSLLLVGCNSSDAASLHDMIAGASEGAYQAEYTAHIETALSWLDKARFDVILLAADDAQLNNQVAQLRQHAPATPIVALTSGEDDATGLYALQSGAYAYLSQRRLAGHTLLRAIHTAIERGRIAAPHANPGNYHILVEHLPFGISQIDRTGQLRMANPATARLLGLPVGIDPVGRSFLDLFPIVNRDYIAGLVARAFAGEQMEIEGSLMVHGQQRVFRSSLIPITGADAIVQALLAITQDVTELIEQRLETEIERDRLSAAIQSSNDAIIMFDLERRLTLVNQAWSRLFGISDHELLGLTDQQILERIRYVFQQPNEVLNILNQLFASPQNEASGDMTIHRPEYHALVWYSMPVRTSAGSSLGRLFIFRDVTRERKADQIKTEFVSTVSHELRTPLTSIKGFTDLILEGDSGPITPDVRELLEIVQSSADRLVAITNDILETSRIEAGQITLNAQPLNPAEAIYLIADAIRPLLARKQQHLSIDIPPELPCVSADRDRLAQIMTNLLSNAHKYTPNQGHIRIHAYLAAEHDAQCPAPAPTATWLVIGVADDGIGIAPQDQEQLFTRFYRVNNPVALRAGGTGLGLSITRSLVELHGGRIWYQSQPESGSSFFFSLPLQL
jgi:PAS domain S-box-containing protein